MTIEESLGATLKRFDSQIDRITEDDVQDAIAKLKPKEQGSEAPLPWTAEAQAFSFSNEFVSDGSRFTPEMVRYWAKRALEAEHPVLQARYALLAWRFMQSVAGEKPDIKLARVRIDAVVAIARGNLHEYETQTVTLLEDALGLACQIKDPARITLVRDAILAFEELIGKDGEMGTWTFAYDILWKNKAVELTDAQRLAIVAKLDGRLTRITGGEQHDPWAAEAAAVRLAEYYRTIGNNDEIRRVLLSYGGAFEKMAEEAMPMLAQSWLEGVLETYTSFGLKADAEKLLRKLRELGPKVADSMATFSSEMKITKEEMDNYVAALIEGDLQRAVARVAIRYLPRKDEVLKEMKKLATESPLMSLIPMKMVDSDGRSLASVGSLGDDLEGRMIHHISQSIQLSAFFLRETMEGFKRKFRLTAELLLEYLEGSPLLCESRKEVLRAGIDAYLKNQPLIAIHLLLPQIEAAVRTLVQGVGGVILRLNKFGGQDLRTLDDLLHDPIMPRVFGGDDVPLYLRILLTDRRGINLRNNVCHGISHAEMFVQPVADMVMHAVLVLSLVRKSSNAVGEETNCNG